ncbi:MAG: isoprenoid biosynthesis glyoxalase ElbB [Sphingobacteriaceae bacterium]|nr:isoprenoid biosynthesis glyoxalase ElbB [Sphingobacteriaceae bacterium]
MAQKNIAVLLAGSGVYDGSEIHEAVFTLLALDEAGASYQCVAPDKPQFHVVNHLTGEPMSESRNVLVESARIARGKVKALKDMKAIDFDALIIPGGFGAAKNLNEWAIKGPDGAIDPDVKAFILDFMRLNKPIGAMCMGPTVVAKALAGSDYHPQLTVGSTAAPSPYDIAAVSAGMELLGSKAVMRTVQQIEVDVMHKIVTAPCYMMEASISDIRLNTKQLVDALLKL